MTACRDALIICTRNRPGLIGDCLERVLAGQHIPMEIWVVDSSDDEATYSILRAPRFMGRVSYVRSSPGLTHQRNVGLKHIGSSVTIVHFIDDDTLVAPNYLATVVAFLDAHPDAVGVGAFPHEDESLPNQLPALRRAFRTLRRTLQMDGPPGGFSRAAVNSPLASLPPADTEVQWLSGCSMSFRAPAAKQLGFDEALVGYGLGEDAEFCLRASTFGKLYVCPSAHVVHLWAPAERMRAQQLLSADVAHRFYFVQKHPGRFRKSAYWLSIVGLGAFGIAKVVSRGWGDGGVALRGLAQGLREREEVSRRAHKLGPISTIG